MSVSDLDLCSWAYDGNLTQLKKAVREDKKLLLASDKNQRTALHWACSSGKGEVVDFLLAQDSEVRSRSENGRHDVHCLLASLFHDNVWTEIEIDKMNVGRLWWTKTIMLLFCTNR